MVAIYATIAVVVAGLVSSTDGLRVGKYYRPQSFWVSGVPGDTGAHFSRSPCPALNALANHGFLPRQGRNITNVQLLNVVMDKFNLELPLAQLFVRALPPVFDLSLLGTHGLLEHDVSLVHSDSYVGNDPSLIDQCLLTDVLSKGNGASAFTVQTFAKIIKERITNCKVNNPQCTFGPREMVISFGESALILHAFSTRSTETVTAERVEQFLKFEQLPTDFQKPPEITLAMIAATSAKIQNIVNGAST